MIDSLTINGFKSIDKQEFKLKRLTILTGLNSTGKSSVIQSLLLLCDFNSSNQEIKEYVKKFKDFNEVRNKYTNAKKINIKVTINNKETSLNVNIDHKWELKQKNDILEFEKNLFYISANRIGQEDTASYDEDMHFGTNGKYVFGYFEQHKDKPVDKKLIKYKEHETLDAQLSYWLKYILGIELRIQTSKITNDQVKVLFNSDGIDNLSPFNLGAGNSYLAKILIMGLSCKPNNIFIVENPEIHLHPKAQARLCDFFVMLNNGGIQSIIETHSEHIINKLRFNTYKNNILKDDIVVFYKPSIRDDFQTISINQNGHFIDEDSQEMQFPEGFFDSTLSELLEIM